MHPSLGSQFLLPVLPPCKQPQLQPASHFSTRAATRRSGKATTMPALLPAFAPCRTFPDFHTAALLRPRDQGRGTCPVAAAGRLAEQGSGWKC